MEYVRLLSQPKTKKKKKIYNNEPTYVLSRLRPNNGIEDKLVDAYFCKFIREKKIKGAKD